MKNHANHSHETDARPGIANPALHFDPLVLNDLVILLARQAANEWVCESGSPSPQNTLANSPIKETGHA